MSVSSNEAFVELWKFVEELGLDQPTENDLKYNLCVLGKAAQLPKFLIEGGRSYGKKETLYA